MLNYNRGADKSQLLPQDSFHDLISASRDDARRYWALKLRLARLGKVMQGEVQRGRLPGAVALIARRGRVAYFESFGHRDPASGAPMATEAFFASIR